MRTDITAGRTFPDYQLPDHAGSPRRLSELQGEDPLILTLARGHYCPKEHTAAPQLAAFYPQIAVATRRSPRSPPTTTRRSRSSRLGRRAVAFLSDRNAPSNGISTSRSTPTRRTPMIPHTLVLAGLIHRITTATGSGRPSVETSARTARGDARDPARLGPYPTQVREMDAGDHSPFHGWHKRTGQKPPSA
jgi:hypothetical protein